MPVTLDLTPEKEAALKAQARARGLSVEDWLVQLAEQQAPLEAADRSRQPSPFWKAFTDRMHSLPAEVFAGLPADGASQHDHYLHGAPKKNL